MAKLRDAVVGAYEVEFQRALTDPRQLIEIHRRLKEGRGRRTLELSLNRSVIVLSIAAWQAYVESLARSFMESLGPPSDLTTPGRTLSVLWGEQREELERDIRLYSTPNADNTMALLRSVGCDPRPGWTWGRGRGRLNAGQVINRLNTWVRIRNSIAHGGTLPTNHQGLLTHNQGGTAVRLRNAESCLDFIERLGAATNARAYEIADNAEWADTHVRVEEMRTRASVSRLVSGV